MSALGVLLYDYLGSICCQMTRPTLVEKGVACARHNVDITGEGRAVRPWYTALKPRAVVPTLAIGGETRGGQLLEKAAKGRSPSSSPPTMGRSSRRRRRTHMGLRAGREARLHNARQTHGKRLRRVLPGALTRRVGDLLRSTRCQRLLDALSQPHSGRRGRSCSTPAMA